MLSVYVTSLLPHNLGGTVSHSTGDVSEMQCDPGIITWFGQRPLRRVWKVWGDFGGDSAWGSSGAGTLLAVSGRVLGVLDVLCPPLMEKALESPCSRLAGCQGGQNCLPLFRWCVSLGIRSAHSFTALPSQ